MKPTFSIILPIYNAGKTIESCLDSLLRIDFPTERYEVILVDNGSIDGSLEIMRRYPFRIVRESVKNSFSARNCGIRNSTGDIIVLTDSDCVVDPGWLKAFEASFSDNEVMACGGKIVSYPPKNAVEAYPSKIKAHNNEVSILESPLFLPWIDTANAAYRRTVFDELGFFDDIHFDVTGDIDMGWRTSLHGYKIEYSERALVQHINRSTLKALMRQYGQYGYASVRLRKKYRYYYENVLMLKDYGTWWEINHIGKILFHSLRNLFKKMDLNNLILCYIQLCVGMAHMSGMKQEMKSPRMISADRDALEKVEPKPLKSGYIVWGRDDERNLYNFETETKMVVNEFGLYILDHIRNKSPFESIVESACMEWDVDKETIEADVKDFTTQLQLSGFMV